MVGQQHWKSIGGNEETGSEDDQLEAEPRDRQKPKSIYSCKHCGLPKGMIEAMGANDRSANPRASKTQVTNRMFEEEGNKLVMVPNDPSYRGVQKLLDAKFGKGKPPVTLMLILDVET